MSHTETNLEGAELSDDVMELGTPFESCDDYIKFLTRAPPEPRTAQPGGIQDPDRPGSSNCPDQPYEAQTDHTPDQEDSPDTVIYEEEKDKNEHNEPGHGQEPTPNRTPLQNDLPPTQQEFDAQQRTNPGRVSTLEGLARQFTIRHWNDTTAGAIIARLGSITTRPGSFTILRSRKKGPPTEIQDDDWIQRHTSTIGTRLFFRYKGARGGGLPPCRQITPGSRVIFRKSTCPTKTRGQTPNDPDSHRQAKEKRNTPGKRGTKEKDSTLAKQTNPKGRKMHWQATRKRQMRLQQRARRKPGPQSKNHHNVRI